MTATCNECLTQSMKTPIFCSHIILILQDETTDSRRPFILFHNIIRMQFQFISSVTFISSESIEESDLRDISSS